MPTARGLPSPAPEIVRAVAWRCRRFAPIHLRDDLGQIGAMAAWASRDAWTTLPELHAKHYLSTRIRGAIIDEVRSELGRRNNGAMSIEYGLDMDQSIDYADDGQDPVGLAMTAQALRALETARPPIPFIARRRLEGANGEQIAEELGVSTACISQYQRALRRCMVTALDLGERGLQQLEEKEARGVDSVRFPQEIVSIGVMERFG